MEGHKVLKVDAVQYLVVESVILVGLCNSHHSIPTPSPFHLSTHTLHPTHHTPRQCDLEDWLPACFILRVISAKIIIQKFDKCKTSFDLLKMTQMRP